MFRFRTVNTGERVAVWAKDGKVRIVDGPNRLFLFDETVDKVPRFSAGPGQYLAVTYKSGSLKHIKGPVSVWLDPVEHASVKVFGMIQIEANEMIVTYFEEEPGKIARKIIKGPSLYMPGENEWVHEFRWHGADPKNPKRKIPRGLIFSKMRTIPDQMYFDVEDVRTSDDALLTVKLMIFFEITDIERMLDQTHDVVADFINAVGADVIDHVSALTFENFKDRTEELNDLNTYKMLVQRAGKVGYRISKVVYRGYYASDALQAMHDNAIEARTKLKLEAETELQAQELADLRLKKDAARSLAKREMEKDDAAHRNALERMQHDEKMRARREEQEGAISAKKMEDEAALARLKARNEEEAAFLKAIKALDVDMTRYFTARFRQADKLIRINGGDMSQLHVHEEV
jgi:hypothetical protein